MYNHRTLETKNRQIEEMQTEQDELNTRVKNLSKAVLLAQTQIRATEDSHKALSARIAQLDKNKSNYTKEVKEIRDANEDTRKLLDTRLPDDLKRLLNEAVQGGKQ